VNDIDKIQNLVNEINSRDQELKNYQSMKIEELSDEIRRIITTQYETIQRIEELELKETQSDLIKYAKMICRNSTERRIAHIQKIYFDKIDIKYKNHK